jgi:hypothetical protein
MSAAPSSPDANNIARGAAPVAAAHTTSPPAPKSTLEGSQVELPDGACFQRSCAANGSSCALAALHTTRHEIAVQQRRRRSFRMEHPAGGSNARCDR